MTGERTTLFLSLLELWPTATARQTTATHRRAAITAGKPVAATASAKATYVGIVAVAITLGRGFNDFPRRGRHAPGIVFVSTKESSYLEQMQ